MDKKASLEYRDLLMLRDRVVNGMEYADITLKYNLTTTRLVKYRINKMAMTVMQSVMRKIKTTDDLEVFNSDTRAQLRAAVEHHIKAFRDSNEELRSKTPNRDS